MARTLNDIQTDATTALEGYNAAMLKNDFAAMQAKDKELVDLEDEFSAVKAKSVYNQLAETSQPMLEAVKLHHYAVISHKDVKAEDGIVLRVESEKTKQINLLSFETHIKKPLAAVAGWQYSLQRFNQLLTMRAAKELCIPVKEVCDSYYLAEKAKEFALGKPVDSDKALLEALNGTIKSIIGDGFIAEPRDVKYLLMTYCKKGKRALSISASNHRGMQNLVADIMHRIVTVAGYTLEFKTVEAK